MQFSQPKLLPLAFGIALAFLNLSPLATSAAHAAAVEKKVQAASANAPSAPSAANATNAASQALHSLFNQYWEHSLREDPVGTSQMGDKRYNDKLKDYSAQAVARRQAFEAELLNKLQQFPVQGLSDSERLHRDLLINKLKLAQEEALFLTWQMPLMHNAGPHLELAEMVSRLDFSSVKDYEDYLQRLQQIGLSFDVLIENMRLGLKNDLRSVKFLMEKVAAQCEAIAATQVPDSPFAQPLKNMPAGINLAEQQRLQQAIRTAITSQVFPAYKKLAQFVQKEYAPRGRTEVGLWALPDGAAHYALRVKSSTTTNLSAEQIHQTGLQEVARIEGEMLKIARKLGHDNLASFNRAIAANPDLFAQSRQDIVQRYERYTAQVYPQLGKLFGRMPLAKMEVKPIESFREKGAPGAQYDAAPKDRSRPAQVMVNTGDFARRSLLQIESTALHEGVPGHHFQIALQQELEHVPEFRKHMFYNAYVEGWALYAESLGHELGAFTDPYNHYGHLQAEMMRAIRLVVDTGLHHKKWSRQQVVDFFRAHSAMDDVSIQSETDRYIAWPGQALGYKIGQLQILALRRAAEKELGSRFDVRAFHDMILGNGALPLNILQQQVQTWVGKQRSQLAGQTGSGVSVQ